MPTLPSATLTELAPTGVVAQSAPADIPVFIGCGQGGTNFQIYNFGSQVLASILAIMTNGPLAAEGGYIANKVPVPTLFVQVPATSAAASASVPVYTGTGTANSFVVGGTISDGWDIVVKITTGGTIGTSFSYQVSLDGGSTFGAIQAASTATTITLNSGTFNGVVISTSITLTLTSTQTLVTSDTIAFWTKPASASILTTTVTRVGSSTSTLVFSGTPNDEYEILVQFLQGGTEGVAGAITFWVSLDGGLTFGAVQTLSTAGTYLIPDGSGSTGITLTVGSGTIQALDQVAAKTTAPVPAFADVQTAMNAVRNFAGPWAFFHLCGRSTRSMRDSIESLMQTYAASGRFTWCSVSARDRITGENVAASQNNTLGDQAWANRLVTEWGTSAGNRTPPLAGSSRCTSPLPGARQNRRSDGLAYIPRIVGITPDTDPGDRTLPNGGALSSDILLTAPTSGVITPTNAGALTEHDARLNPTLYGINFNVLRTWYGQTGLQPGVYPAGGRLMAVSTDIQRWEHRRVLNLADGAMYTAMSQDVLSRLPLNPATIRPPYVAGNIAQPSVVSLTQDIFVAVQNAVRNFVSNGSAPNGKGGITVMVNPMPAIVSGNWTVYANTQIVWKQILDSFVGTIGFTNPQLNGVSTPA